MQRKSLKMFMGVGLVAVALAVTAAVAVPSAIFAQSETPTTAAPSADTVTPDTARPERGQRDASATGSRIGKGSDGDQYLADALGITLEELQAAEADAKTAAIDEAVSQGLITQAQADALKAGTGRDRLGRLLVGSESEIDTDALLAEALDITAAELDAAQAEAKDAALAAAVTDGRLTQAQADLVKAQQALRTYMDENDAYGQIVTQAVSAGALTQAQADALIAAQDTHGGFGGFGGRHGGRGGH